MSWLQKRNHNKLFFKRKKNTLKLIIKKKILDLNFKNKSININVKLIDTGLNTGKGRIKIAYETLKLNADIIMTYGDGLSSIPIKKLLNFHKENKSILTISAVRPKQKYGVLKIKNKKLNYFDNSKSKSDIYINGGFHVIKMYAFKKLKIIVFIGKKTHILPEKKKNICIQI